MDANEVITTLWDRFPLSLTAITAWLFAIVGTLLPTIIAQEIFGVVPSWLFPVQMTLIIGLLIGTLVTQRLRTLRVFAIVLLIAQIQFFVDWSGVAHLLQASVTNGFYAWAADRTVSFLFSVVLLVILLVSGYSRDVMFLVRGRLTATFEPVSIPGLAKPRPWRWYALRWGGGIVLVGLIVSVVQGGRFWLVDLGAGEFAILLPVILLMAGFNAFSEEFIFRAAPLGELTDGLGKQQALVLMGTVFGLFHFYGTPNGIPAVGLGIFLGWFLGKSMIETRGIGFAWVVHVLLDIIVFTTF